MAHTAQIDRGTVVANGTVLYREVRGDGLPLLLIIGSTGDAGWYESAARLLAEEFTVVTYDRRGNSRSPAPDGWATTTMDEQADDAAALLRTLRLAPAIAFGSSDGAGIVTNMILRHPGVLRSAIVHEPSFVGAVSDPEGMDAALMAVIAQRLAEGGPPAALEAFLRSVAGDAVFEASDPIVRERAMGNAELVFGMELAALANYAPDQAELAAATVPVRVAAGADSKDHPLLHYLYEASEWTARAFGVPLATFSGAHVPYVDRPHVFVDEIRTLLHEIQKG